MNLKKLFSFDWFKSDERQKLKETVEYQKKTIDTLIESEKEESKLLKKVVFTGESVTVLLEDNNLLTAKCDSEIYLKIKDCKSKEELINLLYNNESNDKESFIIPNSELVILRENPDFKIIGSDVYLLPSVIPLPEVVKSTFIKVLEKRLANTSRFVRGVGDFIESDEELDILDKHYQSLKMFWYKLSTSSLEKCRESVLRFCKENDVRLSPTGNLITYRAIVSYKKDNQSILNKYIKSIKNPDNYYLLKSNDTDEFRHIHKYSNKKNYPKGFTLLGKVSTIQKDKEEQIYTSSHNRGRYTFKIGDVYKLDDNELPNDDLDNCHSNGLHVGNVNFSYLFFGNTKVVCLVNPSKIIYTPDYDTGKFRCSEMKIACINPNEHGIHIDESLIEQADNEYNDYTIDELTEIIKSQNLKTLSVQEHRCELNLNNLEQIKTALLNKVKEF